MKNADRRRGRKNVHKIDTGKEDCVFLQEIRYGTVHLRTGLVLAAEKGGLQSDTRRLIDTKKGQ